MQKMEKLLNRLATVLVIVSVLACLILSINVLQGREASLFGYRIYHILTGSMEPTISAGSNILVKETDAYALEEGEIITFTSKELNGAANTHRIVAVEEDDAGRRCYVTRGDANPVEDSARVYPEDIKGKVVFHMNIAGFSMFFGFIRTKAGFVTVILMPMMLIMWLFMRDFREQVRELTRAAEEEAKKAAEAEKEAAQQEPEQE